MPTVRTRPIPSQERSRRTEQALRDAALRLFRRCGVDAVTVQEIAAEAGVSPASINRRFGDKEALVREVFRALIESSLAMLEAIPPAPPSQGFVELTAEVTAAVMAYSRANQGLLQSAYARALVDDEFARGLRELRIRTRALLRARFEAHLGAIAHPTPALAIDFALTQAVAMLSARHEAGRLEVESMEEGVFLRELMHSLLGYLQVPFTTSAIDDALASRGL